MLNKNAPAVKLDAPVPGQGMTAPLGGRPWQQPPKFSTAEKAFAFYTERLTQDGQADQLLNLIELGVPVDTLADSLQLGGVMEGLHSVDVGILISPALMETMNQMGLQAGLKPVMPSDKIDPEKSSESEVALNLKKMEEKQTKNIILNENTLMEELEPEVEMSEEKSTGLMARR